MHPLAGQRVPQAVVTVATSTVDAGGRPWVYVRWDVGEDVTEKVFAVYLKSGSPEASASFTLKEIVRPAVNSQALAVLNGRAVSLRRPPGELNEMLDPLYAGFGGSGVLLPEAKFSAIMKRSQEDAGLRSSLERVSKQRPSLAMALGRAWAGPVSDSVGSPVTIELREWLADQNVAGKVVGRVTVNAGLGTELPAPGAPVQLKDMTIAGDRLIRLRWATSDALRLLGLKSNGIEVWRVEKATAEVRNWHTSAPPAAHLIELAEQVPSLVRKVTKGPVNTSKLFSASDVDPLVGPDKSTSYVDDDHEANEPEGRRFEDGEQFYYFAAAVDLLGRPGLVSQAGLAQACQTIPPDVPALEVTVDDTFPDPAAESKRRPVFVCSWVPNINDGEQDTTHYELYRGLDDLADLTDPVRQALLVPFAVVDQPSAAMQKMQQIDDRTTPLADFIQKGFWFAIRAVRQRPWGKIASPFSPPVLATIRDTRPLPAPDEGKISFIPNCPRAAVIPHGLSEQMLSIEEVKLEGIHYRVRCERQNPGVLWAEFLITVSGNLVKEQRLYFAPEEEFNAVEFDFILKSFIQPEVTCIIGTDVGAQSPSPGPAMTLTDPPANHRRTATFYGKSLDDASLQANEAFTLPLLGNPVGVNAPAAVDAGVVRASLGFGAVDGSYLVLAYAGFSTVTAGHGFAKNGVLHFYDPQAVVGQPTRSFVAYSIRQTGDPSSSCPSVLEDPLGSGALRPITFRFPLVPGTRQYHVWRRVDEHDLELMAKTLADFDPAQPDKEQIYRDIALPPEAREVSYYAQLKGQDGNQSPMIFLGKIIIAQPLARPLLATPEAISSENGQPLMRLTWTCPAQGVTQFEISMKGDPPPKTSSGPPYWAINFASPPSSAAPKVSIVNHLMSTDQRSFQALFLEDRERIRTKTVGEGLVDDPPDSGKYSLDIPVTKGVHYFGISVRAVGATPNTFGPSSNAQSFTWKAVPPEESVAWPARPLPPVRDFKGRVNTTTSIVKSALLSYQSVGERLRVPATPAGQNADEVGLLKRPGVLIGQTDANFIRQSRYTIENGRLRVLGSAFGGNTQGVIDPNSLLFVRESNSADKILPVALYRRATSSGRVMQVTPLIEKLAWQQVANIQANTINDSILHDPYIGVTSDDNYLRFYLLDTQPVSAGETYHYLLIRFDRTTKEMIETIDAGTLTIPE